MVKRAKSPEIVEDSRLFAVYQPYPLNPNWAFEEDQVACSRWVRECIGQDHLWVVYHKPSARGMILLEISKAFVDHQVLLGEHRWSDFLKNADAEQKGRTTQVFHSIYPTIREAQKDGWKAIPIKQSWFNDWTRGAGPIKHPYPITHWCTTPPEDKTNKKLCRPLPVDVKPPPPPAARPVVGSTQWLEEKDAPTSTARKAQSKKAPRLDMTKAAQISNTTPPSLAAPQSALSPTSSTAPATPASASASTAPPSAGWRKNTKAKPVPLQQFTNPAGPTGPKKSWGAVQKAPSVGASGSKSPLVDSKPTTPVNAWSKPIKLAPQTARSPAVVSSANTPSPWDEPTTASWFDMVVEEDDKGPTSSNTPGSNNSPSSTRPPSPPVPTPVQQTPAVQQPTTQVHGKKGKKGKQVIILDIPGGLLDEGDSDDLDTMEVEILQPWQRAMNFEAAEAARADIGPVDDGYGAFDGPDYADLWADENLGRKKAPELICPTHNVACPKGICQDMSKLVRQKKREEEMAKRGAKPGSGGGKGRGRGRNRDDDGTSTTQGETTDNATGTSKETEDDGFQKPKNTRGRGRVRGRGNVGRGKGANISQTGSGSG